MGQETQYEGVEITLPYLFVAMGSSISVTLLVHVFLLLLNYSLLLCLGRGAQEGDVCNAAPSLGELLVCTCCKCPCRICSFTLAVSEKVDCTD